MTTAGQGRMAAVLFTDLVGSTELLSRLGEAAFDGLRRAHFAALREAIGRSRGAEVKGTGDGLLATFSSAADAVGCAVAMQQAVEVHGRAAGIPLAIRVGISVGDVSFEDGDVFGTPVVEAARLVAVAQGGQILATALVRGIAGGRSVAAFTDVGCLELKGLPTPVDACDVAWEPIRRSPVPLPALLTEMGHIFVGRESQLERLDLLWKEGAAGGRRVALLGGEPGVGKTRLAGELAARVHADGATVLAGRCEEDLGVPYQPFVEALRHFVDHTSPTDLRDRVGRYGGELARLVPELTERVPGLHPSLRSDPETERYRLFDAVACWLGAASADSPLLLVLDDLQWAAKPTLLLLRHVVESPDTKRLLVVGTYRDTELSNEHPLVEVVADLRRQSGVERLSLAGLDPSGVAAFMGQAAGHELDEDDVALAQAIHVETEGNPFFVREVFRHLTETGALERKEGRWTTHLPIDELGIPESVRDVVGRRLSRLSHEANEALRTAAVMGAEFELSVLYNACTLDEERLILVLEEAMGARLIIEAPTVAQRYRFAHALVRDTLYQGLSGARRVTLHRKVAEAIEAVHGDRLDEHLSALAHHWARASAPAAGTGPAVDYAARAGARALAQLAHAEAVGYYRQGLELLDAAGVAVDDPRRLDLLINLGEAQRRTGDPAHRQTLLDAASLAQRSGDAEALARAALANNRGIYSVSGFVDRDRVSVLETALDAVGPAQNATRARLLGVLAAELGYAPDHAHRERLSTDALVLARRLGDMATLGDVLTRRWAVMAPTAPVERQTELDELADVARRLGDPILEFWSALWNSWNAGVLGNGETFRTRLFEAAEVAATLRQPFYSWFVGFTQATEACMAGRLADAEARALKALEIARAGGIPDGFQIYGAGLLWIRYEQGRLDDVADLLQKAAARTHYNPLTPVALAFALAALDRVDEACPIFDQLAGDDFATMPGNFLWLYGMCMVAETCARLDDRERAAVLYARLAPHAGLVASSWAAAAGAVDHYLGLLATTLLQHDLADGHFAAAARIHAGIPAPAWVARTRLEWARMLSVRGVAGDARRAAVLLAQALRAARELGLGIVEARAAALLDQIPPQE